MNHPSRLMKQITVFVSDIQVRKNSFKIVINTFRVLGRIQNCCGSSNSNSLLEIPHKHRTLVNFLSNILREEGGFAFKKAIVDSVFCIIKIFRMQRIQV